MILDKRTNHIYTNIWFGHFYCPAYNDKTFVRETIDLLKDLGFNGVMQDAKAWEDFAIRMQGGEASPYVQMAEYMQQSLLKAGLSHEFLALYLNGDNLYPNIRFSPPIYGESVVDEQGKDGKWYRYWSEKARASQAKHVKGMLQLYGENYTQILIQNPFPSVSTGETCKKPICSMWDPITAPSFDEEGRNRYLTWLKEKYAGDISKFNAAYHRDFHEFRELEKEDYWFSCRYPGELTYTRKDLEEKNEKVILWSDNLQWKRKELRDYFSDMKKRLHKIDPDLYLIPNLAQWGYFLNVDGSMLTGVGMADLWDTAVRGIDLYELSPYVDCAHFISVPVTPYGDPDPYVVSCSHSMMRGMNPERDFIGGIFWGRFLYHDIYDTLTPEEIIGSMVASGISGYTSYGVCGMDDGGLLHRMGKPFLESLKRGNLWMQQTIPQLGKRIKSQIAILFPTAMAAFETMQVEENKEKRLDLLGWYRMCCDLGFSADVIDKNRIVDGALQDVKVLIIPADDCYWLEPDSRMEKTIEDWVNEGGILVHGPEPAQLLAYLGVNGQKRDASPVRDRNAHADVVMVQGPIYVQFAGKVLADYLYAEKDCEERTNAEKDADVKCPYQSCEFGAVTKIRKEKGQIYSFGFLYGYSYVAKTAPHVPRKEQNHELYPLALSNQTWLADILKEAGLYPNFGAGKGIETAMFENGEILVNHTSYPHVVNGKLLVEPRKAAFLSSEEGSR